MRKDEKELFDLVIQRRMQAQYERRAVDWKNSEGRSLVLEKKYRAIVDALPQEQSEIVRAYEDDVFDFRGKEDELFYRAGLEDGIRLDKMIRRMKKSL